RMSGTSKKLPSLEALRADDARGEQAWTTLWAVLLRRALPIAAWAFHEAEDAVQRTVILLVCNLHKIRDDAHLDAYLTRSLRFAVLRELGRSTRLRLDDDGESLEREHAIRQARDQRNKALTRDRLDQLASMLDRGNRDLFARVCEGQTHEHMAAAFGCTPDAMRKRVSRLIA